MSDIKHTPGPWIATYDGRLIEAEYREGYVASVSFYDSLFCGPEDKAEAAANACLIAAAPDMLDVLMWHFGEESSCERCAKQNGRCIAHAAIAKAEGKP